MGKNLSRKILAVETSGKTLGIALAESFEKPDSRRGVAVRGELFLDAGFRHSEILKESCDFLLKKCGCGKEEIGRAHV